MGFLSRFFGAEKDDEPDRPVHPDLQEENKLVRDLMDQSLKRWEKDFDIISKDFRSQSRVPSWERMYPRNNKESAR